VKKGFHIATPDQIKAGEVADVYFQRTASILDAKGIDAHVRAELMAKALPDEWEWAVLAGLAEVAHLLEGIDVNVRAMEEGTVFRPYEPVLEIQGSYREFGVFETAVLGLICQASGIATRAARCRSAAGPGRKLMSFGARRMHPAIAPMIERAAYIGGCDGVAVVASAELLGTEPVGTIPHALVLIMGDTIGAALAFDEVVEKKVPRVILIDTFDDEKFAAIKVADALGPRLAAVRIDTPGSRRGDFLELLNEVRWELDLRGHTDIDLRGKWSGAKQVLRCDSCQQDDFVSLLHAEDWPESCPDCGGDLEPLLALQVKDGELTGPQLDPGDLRARTLERLQHFEIDPEDTAP
jgi:nicotinate phosphoribosyltransferase